MHNDHHNNHDDSHNETTNNTPRDKEYVDYRTLEIKKARVKFFNADPLKNFGFVTVLDEEDRPKYDAFLSGQVLEKAGIYPPLEKGEILYIRHMPMPKGEAVVLVQKKAPAPINLEKAA